MIDKIGLREPEGLSPTLDYLYNEDTGMEYEKFIDDLGTIYMASWHEDVGQITWFRIDEDHWDKLL